MDGNISPYDGAMQMVRDESNARKHIEVSLATVQSQIDQLTQSVMTHNTLPTASLTSSTSSTLGNVGVPATPSQTPMMLAGAGLPPGLQLFNGFAPPQPQYSVQQMHILGQINTLNEYVQTLKKEFDESGRKLNGIYDTIDNIWGELNEQKQYDQRNNLITHGWDDVPIAPKKNVTRVC